MAIIVGPAQQQFKVHEHLVKLNSAYFRKAFSGNWKEAVERRFCIEEENPQIFAVFVKWLYDGKVDYFHAAPDADVLLVECYQLGERLGVPAFQNEVIDSVAGLWEERKNLSEEAVMLAFTESLPDCKLCLFIVEKMAWEQADELDLDLDLVHPELTAGQSSCQRFRRFCSVL